MREGTYGWSWVCLCVCVCMCVCVCVCARSRGNKSPHWCTLVPQRRTMIITPCWHLKTTTLHHQRNRKQAAWLRLRICHRQHRSDITSSCWDLQVFSQVQGGREKGRFPKVDTPDFYLPFSHQESSFLCTEAVKICSRLFSHWSHFISVISPQTS